MRPRGRRGRTREAEQADEPVPQSAAQRPKTGHQRVTATLSRHAGDRDGERDQANQRDPHVIGARPVEQRRPQTRRPVEGVRELHCSQAIDGQPQGSHDGNYPHHHLNRHVACRPGGRNEDHGKSRHPPGHGQQWERMARGNPQDHRRHEVYPRRHSGEIRHRQADEPRRPNGTGITETERKTRLATSEPGHRHPPWPVRYDDQDEGECRGEVVDVLVRLRIACRSKGGSQGQCSQACADRQRQLPRDLGACHPPELPQQRDAGRTQRHAASTG